MKAKYLTVKIHVAYFLSSDFKLIIRVQLNFRELKTGDKVP